MSTPAKELIAVAHVAFISNEAALKQLVTIFNRIAFATLSVALHPNFSRLLTPEFVKNRPIRQIGNLPLISSLPTRYFPCLKT